MSFTDLAKSRYSVRKFEDKPLPDEIIDGIIAAGHLAPTACNYQPQRIYVIRSADALAKLKECTRCHFDAPCALLVCYDKDRCWTRKYDGATSGDIDASIVTTHMMLKASELGIGSTWVMHFNPEKIRTAFDLPESVSPTALLVMGYPAKDAEPFHMHSEFRPLDEIVEYK